MEIRSLELPLKGFGVEPSVARVELGALSPTDRLKRAAMIFGLGVAVAIIAIPIPIVHLVLVPAAAVLGIVFALGKLNQREVFRHAQGRCPFCRMEQSFTVMGRFRLPMKLHCGSCHRELVLGVPTSALPHSPT
jgi:hypothetical protein